jgi:peptidoglycan/xylan/chitin deacetylase (PgdA/CDA1 family)
MPRRRIRFNGRSLFAILLLVVGVVLPFLSAFSAPSGAQVAAGGLPTARVIPDGEDRLPGTGNLPTAIDLRPTALARQADTPTDRSIAIAPTLPAQPTLSPAPTDGPPEPPTATLTNTPEPLPPVLGPADAPPQPVATLFPTLPPVAAPAPEAPAPGVAGSAPPILMYHYIRVVDQASDPLGYNLSVAPELFEQQMGWLHDQGYTAVRMEAVARCLRGEAACPSKAVALTFDDGYEDAFTTALPALRRYGFTATFYIISGLVGQPGYMSWEQLAALRDAGMEIGAHTIDHPDLTSLDAAEANRQIAQSKADIERGLGIEVASFCYPTGLYNAAIEEQVRAAGYLSAATTRWDGDYSDLLALPRRRIAGGTLLEGFAAIVGGY